MSADIKEKMNCVRKQKLCFSVEGPRTIIIYYHFSALIDLLSKKNILFLLDRHSTPGTSREDTVRMPMGRFDLLAIRSLELFCILRSILVSKTCQNR